MKIFNKLNKSSLDPKASRAATGDSDRVSNLHYAEVACFQLARVKRRSIPAKLGLKHSAQILLDIIKAAQVSWQVSLLYYIIDINFFGVYRTRSSIEQPASMSQIRHFTSLMLLTVGYKEELSTLTTSCETIYSG
jgi:hypothetical protein